MPIRPTTSPSSASAAATTPPATAPSSTTASTATTAAPTPTPARPAGLEQATTAGPLPVGTQLQGAVNAGVSAIAARLGGGQTGPSLLALRPGMVADAVGLPDVIKQLSRGPQADALIDKLTVGLKQSLGLDVPPALIAAARANPERIIDMLAFTPQQMRAGFDAMHAQHRVRTQLQPTTTDASTTTKSRQLPAHFKTSTMDTVTVKRSDGDLQTLAPGLSRGDVPNATLSDAQARKNIVLAEVIDRLADNAGKPKAERFVVEHQGSRFTSLPHFMQALEKDGYVVEAKLTHRVADFFALKTNAPDGTILDVPMAAMVRTGVVDKNGQEAILPTVHSELVFSVRPGPTSKQPTFSGDVKWYQGISGTGFFPCDTMRKSTWTGTTTATTFDHARSLEAMNLCGVLGDVIQDASAKAGLAMSGYGVTGVCNDSVAIIQQAMTGEVTAYPLFMRDAMLLPEIKARLQDTNRMDDGALKALKAAIDVVPSDDRQNASSKARALASIPWSSGQAPFQSTEDARRILAGG